MLRQDRINFIKEWYKFRESMCKKHNNICVECPLCESSDGWYDDEIGDCKHIDNCMYNFEEGYAEAIFDIMESN